MTVLILPLCVAFTKFWDMLWHERQLWRINMRNSPSCLVYLFLVYCPLYHIVYLFSMTSSFPVLGQTSQDYPHFKHQPQVGGSPGRLHFWPAGYKFKGSPLTPSVSLICSNDSQNSGKQYIYDYSFIVEIGPNQNQPERYIGWGLGEPQTQSFHCPHFPQGYIALLAHPCVWYTQYWQPGKLTWALVSRVFNETSLSLIDWLIDHMVKLKFKFPSPSWSQTDILWLKALTH